MADRHQNDLNIEIIVGLFMFLVLIALGVFTIVLSRQNFLKTKYPVHIIFEEVGGLREGDNVFLRGTQVGTVKSTYLVDHHVNVVAELDVPLELREGYRIEVVASSMLGGKIMKVYEGSLSAPRIGPEQKVFGTTPVDMLDELALAVAQIRTFADELAVGQGTIGKLLTDDSLYHNINEGAASLKLIGQQLESGEGMLGKLLQDNSAFEDLAGILSDLKDVSSRLAGGEGTLGKLLAEENPMVDDFQEIAANLKDITAGVRKGEGTLGMLLNDDDELYTEAKALLEELRAAIDDLRETSPVTTFGSVVFGAF